MAIILFVFVVVTNLFLGTVKGRSRVWVILSLCVLGLIMAFAGTESGDLAIFRSQYNRGLYDNGRWEPGYMWLTATCFRLGISFDVFRLGIFLAGSALLYLSYRPFIKNDHFVVAYYAISLFHCLAVTLRFYIGYVIVMLAIRFLLQRRVIAFAALILLGSLFHQTVLVYLVLLLCLLPQKAKPMLIRVLRIVFAAALGIVLILLVIPSISEALNSFYVSLLPTGAADLEEDIDSYLSAGYSRNRVVYVAVYTIGVLLLEVSTRFLRRNADEKRDRLLDDCTVIALINGVCLPLIMIGNIFVRLLYPALTLGSVVFTAVIENSGRDTRIPIGHLAVDKGVYYFLTVLTGAAWYAVFHFVWGFDMITFLNGNTLL